MLIGDSLVFFSSPRDISIAPLATLVKIGVIFLDEDSFWYLSKHGVGRTFTYNTYFKSLEYSIVIVSTVEPENTFIQLGLVFS